MAIALSSDPTLKEGKFDDRSIDCAAVTMDRGRAAVTKGRDRATVTIAESVVTAQP